MMDQRVANILKGSNIRSVRHFRALDAERDYLRNGGAKTWATIEEARATLTDEQIAERFGLVLVEQPYEKRWSHVRVFLHGGQVLEIEAVHVGVNITDGRLVELDIEEARGARLGYLDTAAVQAVVVECRSRTVNPGDPDYDDG